MEFNFIVNPQTNRKCIIYSKQGQRVVKNYLNQSGETLKFANLILAEKKKKKNTRQRYGK